MAIATSSCVGSVRDGILDWLESIRYKGEEGWGRWKYNSAMTRPWAMHASGTAIRLLHRLDALEAVPDNRKQEAIAFFRSCQDPVDHLFKDPLETEDLRDGPHSWEQIWGQRNGAALCALELLNAEPLLPPATVQFHDLEAMDGREWTLSLDWENPWRSGENWTRSILAFCRGLPEYEINDEIPVLKAMFETIENEVLEPSTGAPQKRGCARDNPRAMAGLFKIMRAYLTVGRPVPNARQAIDFTLSLQHENGEFGLRRNMCMNWDALWILRELDLQLDGSYRHGDIVTAGEKTVDLLLRVYRKPDGGFAFLGEHCLTNHHSIRLCDEPAPVSDTLGTGMCLHCLEYLDEWKQGGGVK